MTAAGDRLVALAASSGPAGGLLVSLAAGSTSGERMVARSTLGSSTAAVHLMYDTGGEPPAPAAAWRIAGFMSNLGAFMNRV